MSVSELSLNRKKYLQQIRIRRNLILFLRILTVVLFFVFWELLTTKGILDPFIFSSPSRVFNTIRNLSDSGELIHHISISIIETLAGFSLGTVLGILLAVLLWWNSFLSDVLEPHLIVLNAIPKTALGPVFIVCMGAGMGSIIAMTLAISLIVSILNVHNGFLQTDKEKITMLRTFGANRTQIFTKLVLPSNLTTIINVIKVNIGLSWVGVITGEYLVSKAGLGYLIVYGSQVFKMDLVMTSVMILAFFALLMQAVIVLLEGVVRRRFGIMGE